MYIYYKVHIIYLPNIIHIVKSPLISSPQSIPTSLSP
jgi:hypothetical protein